MERYENYKPTDIEWIGEIPTDWNVKKLKYLVALIDEPNPLAEFVIAVENIEGQTGKLVNLDPDKTFQGEIKGFKKADVLFNKLRPYLAKVYYSENDGGSIGELLTLRAKDQIVGRYLFYRTLSANFIDIVDSSTNGTKMPRANWDSFISQLPIPFPEKTEQSAIADYLDRKTEEIDKLIANKRKLIELLKEERKAIINQAVTKGINPDAKLRPSGIACFDDIPENWKQTAIKYVASDSRNAMVDGPFGSSVNVETDYVIEGIPVVRTVNITERGFDKRDLRFMREEKFKELSRHAVYPQDVLFSKVGTIGNCCIFPSSIPVGILSTTGSCKITVDPQEIIPRYLVCLLNSMRKFFQMLASANVQPFLNMSTIKNVRIVVPPLSEQAEILYFIDSKTTEIDSTAVLIEKEIRLMREYRMALISEVVTGRIKVV